MGSAPVSDRLADKKNMPAFFIWTEFSRRLKHWDLHVPTIVEKPVQTILPSGSKPA